jgi:colicin import membrane protein
VLLRMEPRRHGFAGTRRTANPVLCLGRSCYISAGPEDAADLLSRWKTLGPANSIGRRAGPCRNQLTCVFRNVDLGGPSGAIQPIDMGLWHHDRRDIKTVQADRTCEVISRRLFCATPVIGHRYRAWIVPEAVAAKAGPDALEDALEEGLPSARSAAREPWPIQVQAFPTR